MTDAPGLGMICDAFAFAAGKHRDQRRKDAEQSPYINHPIQLAAVLTGEGGVTDPVVLCAAILHDTVEDTDATPAELVTRFGEAVARVVAEVTDDKTLEKAERKRLQVEHAGHASREAKLVKLADKICNLRDLTRSPPTGWALDRQQQYFDWAKSVVDRVRGVHPALEAAFDAAYAQRPGA